MSSLDFLRHSAFRDVKGMRFLARYDSDGITHRRISLLIGDLIDIKGMDDLLTDAAEDVYPL